MFYDDPRCITLSPYVDSYGTKSGIFLFKNFIDKNLIKKIENNLKNVENIKHETTLISWYSDKISPSVEGLIDVWEKIGDLIGPTWVIHPSNSLLVMKPGDKEMFTHSDSPGKGQCHLLSQTDIWNTCCELDYGLVAYFGDFEGGEIFYPTLNPDGTIKDIPDDGPCFEYKPEKGDLIIHSAFHPYNHGVKEVTSGIRYAFSNFVLKAEDNPGTFYNYGTPEYYSQIGNKTKEYLDEWQKPLKENPQFSKEKIKEFQSSGLEGIELSEKFFKDLKE